jgi:hypothetical protein
MNLTPIALVSAALGAGLVLLAMAWDRDPWTVFLVLGVGAVATSLWDLERRIEERDRRLAEKEGLE